MSTKSRPLTKAEISRGLNQRQIPFTTTAKTLAEFLGVKQKTIYIWRSAGRLEGTYTKRGKYVLFLTERVLEVLFNGPTWK